MKLAIMQPYLFPYIGYFHLMKSVDKFIIYDDVTYIKQGWINRNNILINGQSFMFTIPLKKSSSNTLICDSEICYKSDWPRKLKTTLRQAYSKSPCFEMAFPIIEDIINSNEQYISKMIAKSITSINAYLNLNLSIVKTSNIYNNGHLHSQNRILDICQKEKATQYNNLMGGINLYSKEIFCKHGIDLKFIKSSDISYKQFNDSFIPWLSIIDIMMFNTPQQIVHMLDQYELI